MRADPVPAGALADAEVEGTAADEAESTPVAGAQPPALPARARKPPWADEPYVFEQCTLTVTLQFWPAAGDPLERLVLVSVRSHQDAPLMAAVHSGALGALPPVVAALLEQLRAELPERERAHAERAAKAAPAGTPPAGRKRKPAGKPAPAAPQPPQPRQPIATFQPTTEHAQLDLFAPTQGGGS